MILGIYFALCIQGSLCYFQSYSWAGHPSKEATEYNFLGDYIDSVIKF